MSPRLRARGIDFSMLRPDPPPAYQYDSADNNPWQPWQKVVPYDDTVTFADPAVATGITRTIPGDAWEMILSVRMRLLADANVANRTVSLLYNDAQGNRISEVGASAILSANSNSFLTFSSVLYGSPTPQVSRFAMPIPQEALPPGYTWSLAITNVQAGDQLSIIVARIRRWRNVPRRVEREQEPYS